MSSAKLAKPSQRTLTRDAAVLKHRSAIAALRSQRSDGRHTIAQYGVLFSPELPRRTGTGCIKAGANAQHNPQTLRAGVLTEIAASCAASCVTGLRTFKERPRIVAQVAGNVDFGWMDERGRIKASLKYRLCLDTVCLIPRKNTILKYMQRKGPLGSSFIAVIAK